MDENVDSFIPAYESTDSDINWACKICKDLPHYAEMYLLQRKCEKSQNEYDQRADIMQLKYYCALLHLLDKIHKLSECSDSERPVSESSGQKCHTPEHFDHYWKIYNLYVNILRSENGLKEINLKCDICSCLPYALFSDLDMVAKNIHSDDMEKAQKLELNALVTDCYLTAFGPCKQWEECPSGVNWLELMNSVEMLKEYLETKDRRALHIRLSGWNKIRAIDDLLNTGVKTTSKDFQTQDIPLSMLEGKKLVYLDFGVYQLYEDNEIFRSNLDSCAKMDEIQFVYSPTHMEEACRMDNSVYESKRRENVSKICDNCEVLPVQDGYLKILEESVDVCFARAKKWQNSNRYAEEAECARFEALEEQTYRLLGLDEKEAEKLRKTISALTSIQLFDPENKAIDNEGLNRIFFEICGSRVPLEEFRGYSKEERDFPKIREAIRLLYMLMNALGYHRNKIEKRTKLTHRAFYPIYGHEFYRTIRSGFYDVDHLSYATKCDYFVTCDRVLSSQAIEIYRYLGYKTQVIYCEKRHLPPRCP